jgi:hypothetical protein
VTSKPDNSAIILVLIYKKRNAFIKLDYRLIPLSEVFTDFEVGTVGRVRDGGERCEMAFPVQALQTFTHSSAGCHKMIEGPL